MHQGKDKKAPFKNHEATLPKRYIAERVLANGTFSVVYKAHYELLNEQVAIKKVY